MKRRIVELENGKFSYQFRALDSYDWETSQAVWDTKEEILETLCRWKREENTAIKTIHEEI